MDERRLRYFLAIVEEGGVTAAARRLHVAQPSLSQALRALESELGAELFHRAGRGLRISSAGAELIGPARRVLRAIEEARNAIEGVVELRAGSLEIATLPTLAVDPMAEVIGRFHARYPGIQVRLLEPDTVDGVGTMVRDGGCELGVAHLPLSGGELVVHEIARQELVVVLPPRTSADDRPLRARELAATPLVVSPPATSTRILLEQALAAVGVAPQIAVETAAREAVVPLVLAGAGAALLPVSMAREARRRGAVVRPVRPAITRRVGLVHTDANLSPAARAFIATSESTARANV